MSVIDSTGDQAARSKPSTRQGPPPYPQAHLDRVYLTLPAENDQEQQKTTKKQEPQMSSRSFSPIDSDPRLWTSSMGTFVSRLVMQCIDRIGTLTVPEH